MHRVRLLLSVLAGAALLAGCAAPAPPVRPQPLPPLEVSLELVAGERHELPVNLVNTNCAAEITLGVTSETPWVRLPEPAAVPGLAPGRPGRLAVVLDLTAVPPGPREGLLEVRCVDCPRACVGQRDIRLRLAVASPPMAAVDHTLALFHDLAAADLPRRLRGVHPAEMLAALTREVPGFQEYLRRLRTEAGAEPRFRIVPPGAAAAPWPATWPLAQAPPMRLQAPDAWVLVDFLPTSPAPARGGPAAPRDAPPPPESPPPLFHYAVDPQRWSAGSRVWHLLCAEPTTLRRVVVKLTYADGADRREEAIESARWSPCPAAAPSSARAYRLDQPTRDATPGRVVIASGYFLDRRTQAGPVIAVPLPVD
ncbi:MAG TPA: hypothetical protein VHQ65_05925 [Thermoanaerobaculia bacterium]|nr:hypothetical protein [Thermoanaerobaculia bacterium]